MKALKIICGVILFPLALAGFIVVMVLLGLLKLFEFAYGDIQFELEEDKPKS
jgi:hypothetical protein